MRKAIFRYKSNQGFTLLELMIALALGLLVSAAALYVYFVGQRNLVNQQGAMNLQNSSLFGLGTLVRDIRLANLRSSQPYMDDVTLHGGIVLTPQNLTTHIDATTKKIDYKLDPNLLTRSAIGDSNLDGKNSDQLVIQYKVTVPNQFDCEGKELTVDTYVVQRYFLREDSNKNNDPNKSLVLACKATSYTEADTSEKDNLSNFTGNGEIVIPRVDHFSVLLGVAKDNMDADCSKANTTSDGKLECFGYITIDQYQKLTTKPQIVSVKVGLLIRSADSVGKNKYFNANQTYSGGLYVRC